LAAHLRRLVKEHRGQPITLRARVQLRPVRWRTLAPLGQLPAPAPWLRWHLPHPRAAPALCSMPSHAEPPTRWGGPPPPVFAVGDWGRPGAPQPWQLLGTVRRQLHGW